MTPEDRDFLREITAYAEEIMKDVDPEKVRISEQLEHLRPILQKLAMVHQTSVEEIFIKYMDLATEAAVEKNNKFNDDFRDIIGDIPKPRM